MSTTLTRGFSLSQVLISASKSRAFWSPRATGLFFQKSLTFIRELPSPPTDAFTCRAGCKEHDVRKTVMPARSRETLWFGLCDRRPRLPATELHAGCEHKPVQPTSAVDFKAPGPAGSELRHQIL